MSLGILSYRLVRVGLAAYFIYAGVRKLLAAAAFADTVSQYGLLPEPLVGPAALALSILEVVAGIGLLLDVIGSLAVVLGMLVLFVGVLSYGIWLGLDIDCGCLGPGDGISLPTARLIDLALVAACLFLYGCRRILSIRPQSLGALVGRLFTRTGETNE